MHGITFNGVRKDYLVTLRGKNRPPWAPLRRNYLEVPGRPGAYLEGTDVLPRELSIPVLIESKDFKELKEMQEDLAAWLVTDEPKELIFDDEPDRTYFAVVKDTFDVNEIVRVGVGVIEFICLDPYKYGPREFMSPIATDLTQPLILTNSGTVDTPPTFDITLSDVTTHLDIIGDKDYMRIGTPVDESLYAAPAKTLVLWDQLANLTGWTHINATNFANFVPDHMTATSGTIVSNGYAFSAKDTGTGPKWHGPAVVKTLSEELTDFEVEMQLDLLYSTSTWKSMGRIELYLLDANKMVVGKMSMRDRTVAKDGTYSEMRAGDLHNNHFLVNERGDTMSTWLNFKGIVRLTRKKDVWTAYVATVNSKGVHGNRRFREWTDLDTKFTRKPKYVVLHIGGYDKNPLNPMQIHDVKIWKLNTLSGNEVPYIGGNDDIFTVDMGKSLILKNGEPYMNKDFGARFFNLKPGLNSYVVDPPEAVRSVHAEWRSRYK